MATMQDYCDAIKEAKLPGKPCPREKRLYDEERFIEFVNRNIDMRGLNQHMADFSQGAGVAQALHSIRGSLQSGISQKLGFDGVLFQIGSFYDGSKTGRLNEMDCLYVVSESDVVVQQIKAGEEHFRVYMQGMEVIAREINHKLIAAMKETLSEMTLPDGWTHGGYCSQKFSGVRCNGPAITAMFCNRDENHISLDVTIAFPLTSRLQKAQDFPHHLKEHCQSLMGIVTDIQSEVPRTAIAPADLHLIGNLVGNTWQPTTALAEAEILRILNIECSVKGAVDMCKAISTKQQAWYEENNTWSKKPTTDDNASPLANGPEVIKSLRIYMEADSYKKTQLKDKLNNNMAFQHIWLIATDRKNYKEVLKAEASINTAAVKHIILKTALQMKGAFSTRNKTYRDCLVRAVFEELSDPETLYTRHAILHGVELAKFSVSVNLSHIKDDVARDLQEQCRLILDQGLIKDKYQHFALPKSDQDPIQADYCYTIHITLSRRGHCSVSDAEEIAVVISAMMNTSGGLLQVQIDTGKAVPGGCCKTKLKTFESHLVQIITTEENCIPKRLFAECVKSCIDQKADKISFFINKASDLITNHTCAYILESGDVKCITDHDTVCRLLRVCSCKGEDKCQHHKGRFPELQSALSHTYKLKIDTCIPDTLRTQYVCRHYQLHDRYLTEVLGSRSVSSDIKELVSALANTDGGSIFLGVTCTDPPVVKGYTLNDIDKQHLNEYFVQLINGEAIWSIAQPVHENWKLFVHPVAGSDIGRHVIEIRVKKCVGGMFCSMPLCFEVSHSGDILPLKQFKEWKQKMLLTYKPELGEVPGKLEDHFGETIVKEVDLPSDVGLLEEQTSLIYEPTLLNTEPKISHVFQWWLVNNDNINSESLCFNHCCAIELADDAIDIQKPFTMFPSAETVIEQFQSVPDFNSSLRDIEQKYRDNNGAGVIIKKMADHLPGALIDVLPNHHVCDIIVLKANCRPSVISVLKYDCDKAAAEHYNRTLIYLLKRLCVLRYSHMCDSNTHLCFQRHLYYIGGGFDVGEEYINYPEEYLRPTTGTLNIVRYTLAGILLHCEPLTDRFGDIMVRHLSSIQAKILWEKRSKVTVVEGKAGSGKSVLALEAMRRIKQNNNDQSRIAFLCRGRGLAAFVKYQTKMMGICVDIQTLRLEVAEEMKEEYFSQYTDIFVDDAHALPLSREPEWKDMYHSLFSSLRKPNSHAYILLDPNMQDYRGLVPTNFRTEIKRMTQKHRFIKQQDVKVESLGKIIRNSNHICQFIATNLGDEMDELRNVRNLPEDGAYLYIIEDFKKATTKDEKTLKKLNRLLRAALKGTVYEENHHRDDEEEEEEEGGYYYYQAPFSCGYVIKASQNKIDDARDIDATSVNTLNNLRFPAALKDEDTDHDDDGHGEDEEGENDDSNGDAHAAVEQPEVSTLETRLREVLRNTMYQGRHVAILTENTNDKTWVQDVLRCIKYSVQDATTFPVKCIVVDTLENFEGLESPVILFIVPETWGTGYVGCLKYRLCIATRAISRLEFLVPWDPTGREQDLTDLRRAFQTEPPVDYGNLQITREDRIQEGDRLWGMCFFTGRLYTIEWRWKEAWPPTITVAVYNVTKKDTLMLMATLDLQGDEAGQPRVDRQSGRVYIPCGRRGVYVVRYDGSKLVPVATLRCVAEAYGLAVVSRDTLYVCGWASESVCSVDVTKDRVTARLHPPREVRSEWTQHMAVLGDTVLVVYTGANLVIYRHGVSTPGKLLPKPGGLQMFVHGLTTDYHSSFLLLDNDSHTVYVLDISGTLTHTIPIPGDRLPLDCTVVGGQLWVACRNGVIIVISSQSPRVTDDVSRRLHSTTLKMSQSG